MKQSEISTTILYSWGDEDYIDKNELPLCVFGEYMGKIIKVIRREKINKTHF